jgi:hypothetical protein
VDETALSAGRQLAQRERREAIVREHIGRAVLGAVRERRARSG